MKRLSALVPALLALVAFGQDCATGRYVNPNVFSNVTVTQGVVFGSNIGVSGGNQTLRMDVYQPTGDSETLRPVVVVAFGGSFISGTRADVANVCNDLAKRGYVAVANDYRVGFFLPNQTTTTRAVMRGAHDMRACVRYLRKSVAELGNPYGIDTTRIIVGGVSAGAISALHATYLDQESEIPAVLVPEMPSLGGIEGNSGNPGYSSDVFACYSFSGCLGDSSWIQPGDQPLVSLHEVGDGVVPYYTAPVFVVGLPTGLTASGSHDLHVRADHVGLVNCFKSYPGSGHVGYLNASGFAEAMDYVSLFLGELVCGAPVTCGLSTGVAEAREASAAVWPNPTAGPVTIVLEAPGLVRVSDASGRVVMEQRLPAGPSTLQLGALAPGAYTVSSPQGVFRPVQVVRD
jgi:acetyl esterase/lipase